jgi:hypothetical protein
VENSNCIAINDRRLFNQSDGILIIGHVDADYTQYAPPNSYVNVADFATIKELADYLLLLDKNEA